LEENHLNHGGRQETTTYVRLKKHNVLLDSLSLS